MTLIIKIKPIVFSLACTLPLVLQTTEIKADTGKKQYATLAESFKVETSVRASELASAFVDTTSAAKQYPLLETHIKNQQFKQAYKRVTDLRDLNEGNPRFDYLSGISALEMGHNSEAIFTLERVTASHPKVIRPHLELARAYLKNNNSEAAIRELNTVLSLDPPVAVKEKVNAYLVAIKTGGKKAKESVVSALVSFSLGYDDNINLGFSEDEISLPLFGHVALNPSSIQQESGFAETHLEVKYRKAQSKHTQNLASLAVTHRENFANSDFNTTSLDLRAGRAINKGKNKYQLMLRDRPVILGGETYSNTLGLDALLHSNIGSTGVTTGLSLENYDYKLDDNHDRKRAILSARLDKKLADNLHQISAYGGTEIPDNDAGKEFSKDMLGVGYRLFRPWNKKQKSYLSLNYQHNEYQAPQAIYQQVRKEDQVSIKLGHHTRISDNWGINTSIQHNNKNSNLELFDASRNEIKVGVQYDWN